MAVAPEAGGGALGQRARDALEAVLHVAVRRVYAHELLAAVEVAEPAVGEALVLQFYSEGGA